MIKFLLLSKNFMNELNVHVLICLCVQALVDECNEWRSSCPKHENYNANIMVELYEFNSLAVSDVDHHALQDNIRNEKFANNNNIHRMN